MQKLKLGYLLYLQSAVLGPGNGIRKQAEMWADGLRALGHEVDYFSPWGKYDWKSYDLIHVFSAGLWLEEVLPSVMNFNRNVVLSPIVDSNQPYWLYKLASRSQIKSLRMKSFPAALRRISHQVKAIYVRSEHERGYFTKALGLPEANVQQVKLGVPLVEDKGILRDLKEKEFFCFHLSTYYQSRKNVLRLIDACHRIGVPLVIAGSGGNDDQSGAIRKAAEGKNVKICGFLTDEELQSYYSRARVFALPSLCEGVGLAAIEAVRNGCELVITERGGPPDYFGDYAHYVNPMSVSSITAAIQSALTRSSQPDFATYANEVLSIESSVRCLVDSYMNVLEKS